MPDINRQHGADPDAERLSERPAGESEAEKPGSEGDQHHYY